MCLESLLIKHFGIKKAFLKRKRLVGYLFDEPVYEHWTSQGGKAYEKLTRLLYDLDELLGEDFDANSWVETLDNIANEEY